jgi:hypothetical protein
MNPWWYIALGWASAPFLRVLSLAINRAIVEHRRKRFIALVRVTFPDNENITIISVDSSDRKSMKAVERQLREQYKIPEGEKLEGHYRSSGGFRN